MGAAQDLRDTLYNIVFFKKNWKNKVVFISLIQTYDGTV